MRNFNDNYYKNDSKAHDNDAPTVCYVHIIVVKNGRHANTYNNTFLAAYRIYPSIYVKCVIIIIKLMCKRTL